MNRAHVATTWRLGLLALMAAGLSQAADADQDFFVPAGDGVVKQVQFLEDGLPLGPAAIIDIAQLVGEVGDEKPADPPAPETAAGRGPDEGDTSPMPRLDPEVDPDMVEFTLADGSKISGRFNINEIQLETSFCILTIPVEKISRLAPGLNSRPELDRKIGELIDKAAAPQYSHREQAENELLSRFGPGVRDEIVRRMDPANPEQAKYLQALLDKVDEHANERADEPAPTALVRQDVVVTPHFTATGRISPQEFQIASRFGTLTVKLADIHAAERPLVGDANISKVVRVDGSNIIQVSQCNTRIHVARGDRITIRADGQITMTPWGTNYTCGPDGDPNQYGWYVNNEIPSGMLIAKIGNNDAPIKLGSRNTFTAKRSGMLYLAIGMHPGQAGSSFPGQYNVRVQIERQ